MQGVREPGGSGVRWAELLGLEERVRAALWGLATVRPVRFAVWSSLWFRGLRGLCTVLSVEVAACQGLDPARQYGSTLR
jgi:hypothetical protein